MTTQDATIGGSFPTLVAVTRWASAVVFGGLFAAVAWLFVLQEGQAGRIFGVSWTDHDFPDGLGNAVGASRTARTGLYLTLAIGVAVALIYGAVERRLPGRGAVKGLSFAPALFLAWGLLFTPLIDSRQIQEVTGDFAYLPTGVFGTKAGAATIVSGIVASVVASVILARVYSLMRDADWWQAHPSVGHGLGGDGAGAELLELAEQRPEQGVEGPR